MVNQYFLQKRLSVRCRFRRHRHGGALTTKTLSSWVTQNYSESAYVSGISIGDGSGALTTYHAFTDDVTLRTTHDIINYNIGDASASMPEQASMALLTGGIVMAGLVRKRRGVR